MVLDKSGRIGSAIRLRGELGQAVSPCSTDCHEQDAGSLDEHQQYAHEKDPHSAKRDHGVPQAGL